MEQITFYSSRNIVGHLPFKCDVCHKRFNRKVSLEHHMRGHTGERPYKCNYCPKAFRDATRKRVHERVHTGEKPYPCHYCEKQFSTSSHLKNHIRCHTGEKPYSCKYPGCLKYFSTASSLSSHLRTHPPQLERQVYSTDNDNESNLANDISTTNLVRNGDSKNIKLFRIVPIQQHGEKTLVLMPESSGASDSPCNFIKTETDDNEKYYDNDEEPMTINLPDCDVDFLELEGKQGIPNRLTTDEEFIQQEQKIKSGAGASSKSGSSNINGPIIPKSNYKGTKVSYPCETCGETFEAYSVWNKHVLEHSENPYPCTVCGDSFETVLALNIHRKVHSSANRKVYCPFCDKPFLRNEDMRGHVAAHQRVFNQIQKEKRMLIGIRNTLQITNDSGNQITSPKTYMDVLKTVSNKFASATVFKKFNCKYCPKIYIIEDDLKAHLETHVQEANRANQLGGKLKDKAALIPSEEKKFACSVCPLKFRLNSTLLVHERRHRNESPYTCEYCKQKFGNPIKLQLHLRLHTGEKPYNCSLCAKRFAFGSSLRKHMAKQHHVTYRAPLNTATSGENGSLQQSFTDSPPVSTSKATTIKVEEKLDCQTQLAKLRSDGMQFLPTNVLSNEFQDMDDADADLNNYNGLEDSTGSTGDLIDTTPLECPFCPRICRQKTELKAHIRSHTGERPFGCEYCGKRFTQRGHLTMHVRIHTGEKPFRCPYCLREFNQHSNLKSHLDVHKKASVHTCTICNTSFNTLGAIQKHMSRHSYVVLCEICNRAFSHQEDLDEHMATHSNDKPFVCGWCNKRFTRKTHLTIHERVHDPTNESTEPDESESLFETVQLQIPKKGKFHCFYCSIDFPDAQQFKNHTLEHSESERMAIFVGAGAIPV